MRAMTSFRLLSAAACVALPLMMGVASAYAQAVSESKLKVALIYNFIMFTEWPATGSAIAGPIERSRLPVCVQKTSELFGDLLQLDGRTVRNRSLQIVPLSDNADYPSCTVLVVDAADRSRLPQIRKKTEGKGVLTILDGEDINDDGAMIAISPVYGRMVFDVNTTIAQQASVTISSKLLRLARKVQ